MNSQCVSVCVWLVGWLVGVLVYYDYYNIHTDHLSTFSALLNVFSFGSFPVLCSTVTVTATTFIIIIITNYTVHSHEYSCYI